MRRAQLLCGIYRGLEKGHAYPESIFSTRARRSDHGHLHRTKAAVPKSQDALPKAKGGAHFLHSEAEWMIAMNRKTTEKDGRSPLLPLVIYKTRCENPGCGFDFNLRIGHANVGLLCRRLACPRCGRPGGLLKRVQRIADRIFSARLQFRQLPG